jgi:hypothetical protein
MHPIPISKMMDNLLDRIEKLEQENVETTNVLYEILNRLELLENDYVLRSDKFREGDDTVCQ